MTYIPAREACIYWTRNGDVTITRARSGNVPSHHRSSGGACWAFWQEASPEALYFRLLQMVCHLILDESIPPEKVHEAFKVVPECRLTLPSDHPDRLSEDDEEFAEPANFGAGYPAL